MRAIAVVQTILANHDSAFVGRTKTSALTEKTDKRQVEGSNLEGPGAGDQEIRFSLPLLLCFFRLDCARRVYTHVPYLGTGIGQVIIEKGGRYPRFPFLIDIPTLSE